MAGVPSGCGGKQGSACPQYATVEPLSSVWGRVSALVEDLEAIVVEPSTIVLVSHGDTLQITQTAFEDKPLSQHRSLTPLQQAEWRILNKSVARDLKVKSNL
eukprot:TRINITY_DN60526_c0_g1_i2.p1 TRINITY_DN60526_c0_g1~~TRINITY_DN60526_c0_g1_i2.p1  ORF type:complete len:102 (+),score=14.53 TRINITY_DN60526_c0_g1_i2:277-582(+)